jgi:dCMP deaminase
MKRKFIDAYMDVAKRFALLSSATRLKVGAIIVKDDRIISIGYNGTPAGWSNECETIHYVGDNEQIEDPDTMKKLGFLKSEKGWYRTHTKNEVIHAEANAIAKLAKSSESGEGSMMFLTHSPCIHCAKQIYTAGIRKVFFSELYRDTEGLDFLRKCSDIEVEHI